MPAIGEVQNLAFCFGFELCTVWVGKLKERGCSLFFVYTKKGHEDQEMVSL